MELTDTHCHIYLPEFNEDRSQALERAFSAGVTRIFLPNVDASTVPDLLHLSKEYPENCFPLMGLHPTSVNENYKEDLEQVERMLSTRKFYGIGEIGIDLYWDKTFLQQQLEVFATQLRWASEKDLPVVVHVRESHDKTIEIIKKSGYKNLRGIFHCFTGTLDQAKEIIGLGFHLGIGGVSTFKNSGLSQILPQIDIQHIVLETDAPYLAPAPFRGKRNEPSFLVHTASKVAEIYGMTIGQIADATSANSKTIFGI